MCLKVVVFVCSLLRAGVQERRWIGWCMRASVACRVKEG